MKSAIVAFLIVSYCHLDLAMPQNLNSFRLGTRENPSGGFRPIIDDRNQEPAQFSAQAQRPGASIGSLTPAFAPPDLYIAPQFDEFGDPLTQIEDPEDYNYYEDYPEDYYDTFEPESRPRLPRPHNSNLGPDLQPRLPQFDILHATEVLRSRDKDQSQLLNPGQVNAGVLPLAYENTGPKLGLFPPLLDP